MRRASVKGNGMAVTRQGKQPKQRQLQVAEKIRQILSEIFLKEIFYGTCLEDVTITIPEVRVSSDLKNAVIYVLPFGKAPSKEFIETLNSLAPEIKNLSFKKLELRHMPQLMFKIDETFDEAQKMEAKLASIK